MTKATHTPGPWLDTGLSGHPTSAAGELHTIVFSHGSASEGNRASGHVAKVQVLAANEEARARARANARLIAAAPDMLDMLIKLLPYIETAELDPAYKPGAVAKITKELRALIERA